MDFPENITWRKYTPLPSDLHFERTAWYFIVTITQIVPYHKFSACKHWYICPFIYTNLIMLIKKKTVYVVSLSHFKHGVISILFL